MLSDLESDLELEIDLQIITNPYTNIMAIELQTYCFGLKRVRNSQSLLETNRKPTIFRA